MARGFGLAVRRRDGRVELRLGEAERRVLADVFAQLREALLTGGDDPGLRRLFPPAHPDDPEAEAAYQSLVAGELLESRLAALDVAERTLAEKVLDPDAAAAWMRSLNALRLVLGTRLEVQEDDDRVIDPDDPDAPAWALYELLSALVDDLVRALATGL